MNVHCMNARTDGTNSQTAASPGNVLLDIFSIEIRHGVLGADIVFSSRNPQTRACMYNI
jgi:hypothetical protein